MKIFVSAIALAFAVPAAAQTAPAAQPHAAHGQHQSGSAASSGQTGHAGHQMPANQHGGPDGQHQGHSMGGGCCADRNGNGRMDCCEGMAAGAGGGCCQGASARPQATQSPAQPQAHQNH